MAAAVRWFDFDDQAMALVGDYDLCVRVEKAGGFRWWICNAAAGFRSLREGRAGTMTQAKAAAEAAHADYLEHAARMKALRKPSRD